MALVEKRIYRISDNLSAINPQQIGVQSTVDADLGFKMYGGKDDEGNITQFLAKGLPGLLTTLKLTGGTTTGELGLLRHDVDGGVVGGQLTVSQFNNFISDGGIQWTKSSTKLIPLVDTDTILIGDGTESAPGVGFKGNPTSGVYYGTIATGVQGVGITNGGVEMAGFGVTGGEAVQECSPALAYRLVHNYEEASGSGDLTIESKSTQSGIPATLEINCNAVSAAATITIDSQNVDINVYNDFDLVSDLGTVTIQAQGTTLGGIVNEADWFEFQNYTAYSPIPVWNTNTQWAAYESTFGTEYPILQALVDLSSGTISAPSAEILYGTGGGVTSEPAFKYNTATNELVILDTTATYNIIIKHDGTSGRIITNSSPVAIGNEVTDHSLNAAGDLIVRKLEVNNNLYADEAIVMSDATRLYMGSSSHRCIFVLSTDQTNNSFLMTVNSSKTISIVDETYISSDFGISSQASPTLFIFSSTNPSTDPNQYGFLTNDTAKFIIGSGKGFISFDESVLIDIGGASYENYSVDATTPDAFTFNPNNGVHQNVEIDANTTFTLVAPTGGNTRTTVVVDNTDASAHDIDFEYSGQNDTVHYVPSSIVDDTTTNVNISCAAGELTAVTIIWDHNDGTDDHWIISASPTTEIEIGAPV